ncbi:hypothetical protein SAMN05518871_105216 [Psychrobacillus sp. OK028]|nr:hypothetical protein SAMN05518871_105216 [Psychrobacillus sp. OK028]
MKLNTNLYVRIILDGIIAGVGLTLFFKVIQSITGYQVYTLLLNIDYIPHLNEFTFPEVVEVAFHLLVSIVLSIFLFLFIQRLQPKSTGSVIGICVSICFIIGALYFPTTLLSNRTPAISSIPSLVYWLIGHVLYGCILGKLLQKRLYKH